MATGKTVRNGLAAEFVEQYHQIRLFSDLGYSRDEDMNILEAEIFGRVSKGLAKAAGERNGSG